jgi:hypothetical protein
VCFTRIEIPSWLVSLVRSLFSYKTNEQPTLVNETMVEEILLEENMLTRAARCIQIAWAALCSELPVGVLEAAGSLKHDTQNL